MKTAIFSTTLFLLASLNVNASTFFSSVSDAPCITCNTPDGLAAGSITGATATLTWNTMTDATQYNVKIQDEQNTPSTFHVETTVPGASYTVAGLQAGVLYKFKVRARCGSNKSDWSGWTFFKADNGGSGPGACIAPTGLTASVAGSTATLAWNAVGGAAKYTIEVEDEQNSPSVFHLEDSAPANSYTLTDLKPGVLYKFKVRTSCAGGNSDWSSWMFFKDNGNSQGGGTGPCATPIILSANVNGSSAKLIWNHVSGAAQYFIEVEDEQNVSSNFQMTASTQDSFYTITGLQTGVSYKFKVSAQCSGGGNSNWSGWLFFNGNTGNTGSTGTCATPTGVSVSNLGASSAVLVWDAMPGASSYTIEVERGQLGAAPWKITQVVPANSFPLSGLDANTRYKFKVRANCTGGGQSDWSAWHKFKTAVFLVNLPDPLVEDRSSEGTSTAASTVEMQVWPNPAQTMTTVRLQGLHTASVTLHLVDLTGRVVLTQTIHPESDTWEGPVNLGNMPGGVYLLRVSDGQSARTLKLMVTR